LIIIEVNISPTQADWVLYFKTFIFDSQEEKYPNKVRTPGRRYEPQPSDPKEWDFSSYRGQDAGSLPGDFTHLARFARYASNIPRTQKEAARLMDDILTPIPIDLNTLNPKS